MDGKSLLISVFVLLSVASLPVTGADGVREAGVNAETQTSAAVVVSGARPLVHTAQLAPVDAMGAVRAIGQAEPQCEDVLDQLETVLNAASSGMDQLVKINVYTARPDVVPAFRTVFARRMAGKARPAISFVVGTLASRDALVAVDAVAVARQTPRVGPVYRQTLATLDRGWTGAHVATAPAGARVYISGQAETGADMAEATRKTLAGLGVTLDFLKLTKSQVLQVKSFLQPISAIEAVSHELVSFFGADAVPPSVFVEWRMPGPIEIELIVAAGRQDGGEPLELLTPPQLKPSPVFSRIARINRGDTIFVSGLYGPPGATGTKQIQSIFESMQAALTEAGGDLRHLVKATYYVTDDDASRALNELRPRLFDPTRPPAASKATVAGVGEPERTVTVDMIAVPRTPGR